MKMRTPLIACVVVASTAALATADIREEYATQRTRSTSHNAESKTEHHNTSRLISLNIEDGLFQNTDVRTDISLGDWKSSHGKSVNGFETDDVFVGFDDQADSPSLLFGKILAGRPERTPIVFGRTDTELGNSGFDSVRRRGTHLSEIHNRWSKDFDDDHAGDFTPSIRFIPAPGGLPLAGLGFFLTVTRRIRRSRA